MLRFVRHRLLAAGLILALSLPLSGCGAIMSTYLILVASSELDGAEAAEAQKFAPYEYTAAQQYLQKAREEQGYADFGAAIEYAFKAQELAEKGRERAEKVKRDQQPPPGVPTAPVEPTPEEGPASNVIIRKKPEDATPVPEPTPEGGAPVIVPVQPEGTDPGTSSDAPPTDDDEDAPEIRIVPINPPAEEPGQPDPGTAPQ